MLLTVALVCLLAPASASALHVGPQRGDRIGVLDPSQDRSWGGRRVASCLRSSLVQELRRAGYDAYDTRTTYEELERDERGRSADDFYLEVSFAESDGGSYGGVGVGRRRAGAEISVVAAHVTAEIRIYRATTLQLVRTLDLDASSVAPMLTAVGVGGRDGYLYFPLPFLERLPYRIAAGKIAREAAERISGAPVDDEDDEEEADDEEELKTLELTSAAVPMHS